MSNFVTFRHVSNGQVRDYPEHYENHPVLGADLERYDAAEYEEDKVVIEDNRLPVEQRSVTVAHKLEDMKKDELVEAAESRGLSTSGNKDELIERIREDKENN